jgi:hypothetical protein
LANSCNFYNITGHIPVSKYFNEGESVLSKVKISKAAKSHRRGIEFGDVNCFSRYAACTLESGLYGPDALYGTLGTLAVENSRLHLAYPFILEGVIRGHATAYRFLSDFLNKIMLTKRAYLVVVCFYWLKQMKGIYNTVDALNDTTYPTEVRSDMKEFLNAGCIMCGSEESSSAESTLKCCAGCNYVHYCGKSCAKKHWNLGHKNVCRHVGILKKYHRPFASKIRDDVLRGIHPKDIPELQTLRRHLGLDRPESEYKSLISSVASGETDPINTIMPLVDGTVQIGSIPKQI